MSVLKVNLAKRMVVELGMDEQSDYCLASHHETLLYVLIRVLKIPA